MRKKALFIFVLILALMLGGCADKRSINSFDVLVELLAVSGEEIENNGVFYFSNTIEGDLGYLSDTDRELIFGQNSDYFVKIENYAGFISARVPAEIWVFKCYSSSDCDDIVRMSLERSDAIKVALHNTEWREKSENISIKIYKRYVVLSFVDNPQSVHSKASGII